MRTEFTLAQLADPDTADADAILRSCVHCGFCTATCPTYVLLGDELDSPRGRITLIKDMLERGAPPSAQTVTHLDRCLSCYSCMTTCPSGVHYMHLVGHARAHVERTYRRPLAARGLRALLAFVLPANRRFRAALRLAACVRPLARFLSAIGFARTAAMLALAPERLPPPFPDHARRIAPAGRRKGRVALMPGCVTPVIGASILAATVRVLTRHGIEVVLPPGQGCCGGVTRYMGRSRSARAAALQNIDAWMRELEGEGLDAVLITASGCGTTVKDYGFMLRNESPHAEKAARIASLAMDICEYLWCADIVSARAPQALKVAYHGACSLQHGQKITREPKELLKKVGFTTIEIAEAHLCCGSAGTYNILQPNIAKMLRTRKVGHIEKIKPDVIAAGNIGCITQIAAGTTIPVVHPVELIDWATGGRYHRRCKEGLPPDRHEFCRSIVWIVGR